MDYNSSRAIAKLLFVLLIAGGLLIFVVLLGPVVFRQFFYSRPESVVFVAPFKKTAFQGFGLVLQPEVSLPLKTKEGQPEKTFLLDSGAVVSSLPREMVEPMGIDLAFLPRSTFQGFGGTTSFAYNGNMTIVLGEEELTLPAVFTEAQGTRYILGRKGLFDKYSIFFDHQNLRIEFRK